MNAGFPDRGTLIIKDDEGYTVTFFGEMLVDGFWVYGKEIECRDPEEKLITDETMCEKLIERAKAFMEGSQYRLEFDDEE